MVGTFHGLAHRIQPRHWREAGLPQAFQILDSEDQQRLIRRMIKGMELDENTWVPREIQWFINNQKDEGRRPDQLRDEGDPTRRQMIHLYRVYQDSCERSGLVDFAELLLRALELWAKNPELLESYRHRFRHILIDEFQDTNAIQYNWLRLLAGDTGIPFAVGDDEQSIYRWRGARTEHLARFRQDFPGARLVKLEQNYRSTSTILKAANALIAHNHGRIGKELWTDSGEGTPIRLFSAYNEREEASSSSSASATGWPARWLPRSTTSTASRFERKFLKDMAELQLLGICIPEEWGGAGMDFTSRSGAFGKPHNPRSFECNHSAAASAVSIASACTA